MMRRWLGSLVGQTTLVLLLGVILSNLIGLLVYSGERLDVLTSARGYELARHIAIAARLLEEVPPNARRQRAWSLRRPGLRLTWGTQPRVPSDGDGWQVRLLRRAFLAELGEDADERLRLSHRRGSGSPDEDDIDVSASDNRTGQGRGRRGGGFARLADVPLLVGQYRLNDGTWLGFAAPIDPFRPFWATPAFAIMLGTTSLVLLVGLWAVRRAIGPLALFAAAAERLGRDVKAPPILEHGPSEVRRAANAFNHMQTRLQRFIADRTLMLAAMSHDLRTPLTRLRLRAEAIEDAEQKRKTLADLAEMEAMLTATLSFARDEATSEEARPLDVSALLRAVCDEWEDLGCQVSYRGPDRLSFIGRPLALKRAFGNLIGNAIRYGGGAQVELAAEDSGLSFTVDDHGPGIPEEALERVFEPFYRLDESRGRATGGVGLGLAVVRAVVDLHGGRIRLENRQGGGLRAAVYLPSTTAGSLA